MRRWSPDAAGHGQFRTAWYSAFPDIAHHINEAHPTDTGIAVRFTAKGAYRGSFMGIPATNRPIGASGFVFLDIADGKVTSLRAMFDQMGLMRQLGVLPS